MRQSKLLVRTKKEIDEKIEAVSHKFLVKGDFIEEAGAGIYSFLPLGFLVLKKIADIIREEMQEIGAQEILLPALHQKELWQKSGRWEKMDPPLFKLKDRHQKEFALASTHEEIITQLFQRRIYSFRDLPVAFFQIQTKFRNEMRATGGLLRQREFWMKDLYSFHAAEEDAVSFYERVKKSYYKIFRRCGIDSIAVEAMSGTIGGALSHEFMVESEAGENKILVCTKCTFGANVEKIGEIKNCPRCKGKISEKSTIELGHVFYLGEKYSKTFNLKFSTDKGNKEYVKMGCFGIGIPRLMASVIEKNHDEKGIIWPREIAPFLIHLIPLWSKDAEDKSKVKRVSDSLYLALQKSGVGVLLEDRENKSVGEKFADSDLIGIPFRLVVSEKTLKKSSVEIKKRGEERGKLVKIDSILKNPQKIIIR
ncbi:MAG: proline--tRNA ligase [Patescibacteria group bacterium]